eukprot:1196091-Prorocentrum_minimum.AAC.5
MKLKLKLKLKPKLIPDNIQQYNTNTNKTKLPYLHVVVVALEAGEALLKLLRGELLGGVGVEAAVDQVGNAVLAPAADVREGRVVVDEGRACQADASIVKRDI